MKWRLVSVMLLVFAPGGAGGRCSRPAGSSSGRAIGLDRLGFQTAEKPLR